jgi:ATP-dependent Clp protease ATP-binding subunit ClpA
MGARPMQRIIQDTIRKALADELLFGRLTDGGNVTVDVDKENGKEEKVVLRFAEAASAKPEETADVLS